MADIREKVPVEELLEEQQEIEDVYRSMRFAQQIRANTLACFKACGGTVKFPFQVDQIHLQGKQYLCFGDCLNVKFEQGPFLGDLGEVQDEFVPKKFVWAHGI